MSTAKCHNIALGISLVGCWFLCQEFRPKKSKNTMKALDNRYMDMDIVQTMMGTYTFALACYQN